MLHISYQKKTTQDSRYLCVTVVSHLFITRIFLITGPRLVEFPEVGEDDDKLGLEAGLLGVESNVHRVRFAGTDTGLATNSIGVLYELENYQALLW